jgi:4-aminobutyrate aminotransferase
METRDEDRRDKWRDLDRLTSRTAEKSLRVARADARVIPRASSIKYFPLCVDTARGCRIRDLDGNEYLDFVSGASIDNVGHGHPRVREAIHAQVDRNPNCTLAYFYEEPAPELAERLIALTPGTFPKKVTFGYSGSDGVDAAIKAARAFTGRRHILSFRGSYHGMTYGALSATGIVAEASRALVGPLGDVSFLEYPDVFRNPWGIDGRADPEALASAALAELRERLASLPDGAAAVILEPIQGDAGVRIPPAAYLRGLRTITRERGILLIDEEVQTGLGRTGRFWGIEHFGTEPDILVSAKALGGGMPISATVARSEILDCLPAPMLAYTHIGHAVNAAAALATLRVIEEEGLVERAERMGRLLRGRLGEIARGCSLAGDLRGLGMMIGMDLVDRRGEPDRAAALKVCWRAWELGLIVLTLGERGNVLRIQPPLVLSESEAEEGLEILERALRDVEAGRVPDGVVDLLTGW